MGYEAEGPVRLGAGGGVWRGGIATEGDVREGEAREGAVRPYAYLSVGVPVGRLGIEAAVRQGSDVTQVEGRVFVRLY